MVESYPPATSLNLPTGETRLEQQYIPADGFTTGRYTFTLVVDSVDPNSGVETVLARTDIEGVLLIPS